MSDSLTLDLPKEKNIIQPPSPPFSLTERPRIMALRMSMDVYHLKESLTFHYTVHVAPLFARARGHDVTPVPKVVAGQLAGQAGSVPIHRPLEAVAFAVGVRPRARLSDLFGPARYMIWPDSFVWYE